MQWPYHKKCYWLAFDPCSGDFAGGNINLNGIVSLDQRIGITDGATVVGNNKWYTLNTKLSLTDFAQFVL